MGEISIKRRRNSPDMSEYSKFDDGEYKGQQIPFRILGCEELVKKIFGNSSDIVIQAFQTTKDPVMIMYVDGLVNKGLVHRDIIKPIKSPEFNGDIGYALQTEYKEMEDVSAFVNKVLAGDVAIFYEGIKKVYLVDLKGWSQRAVATPQDETVVRGPQEGFTENIRTNSALIRRKIKTPKLAQGGRLGHYHSRVADHGGCGGEHGHRQRTFGDHRCFDCRYKLYRA